MPWQISNAQWREWIEHDGSVVHASWVSCDDFDESLRQRLGEQPFLGTSENTVVGAVDAEGTVSTMPPTGAPDSFDSMATVVRMAPDGLSDDGGGVPEPEAAQTLVRGSVHGDDVPPAGLQIGVEGGGYNIELEPTQASYEAPAGVPVGVGAEESGPVRSGQTLRTEPVPLEPGLEGDDEDAGEEAVPHVAQEEQTEPQETAPAPSEPPASAQAIEELAAGLEPGAVAEPAMASASGGLYIPLLTRAATDAELPPEPAEPAPGVVEPVSPASSGTMVVGQPDPAEVAAPVAAQTGQTVIIHQPTAPASDHTVIAPEPIPGGAELVAEPAAATSETAGEIVTVGDPAQESLTAGEIPEDVRVSQSDKIVIGAVDPVTSEDSDEIDVTDMVEEAEEAEEAEFEELAPAPEPEVAGPAVAPPPSPPPAVPREERAAPDASGPELAELASESTAETSDSRRKVPGWYDEVFGDHFTALRRRNLGRIAKAEVEFFVQGSGLAPGCRILDVGCGDGAHAITLAQRGYVVTAIDSAENQVARATQAAAHLGVPVNFLHLDMRDMALDGQFEGILLLGTTLGYFEDDVNRRVLRRLRERLAPGGRLMIEVFNRDYVASRLPSRSWWQGHGCLVLDEAQMNYFKNRMHVHRTVVFEDGRQFEHNIHVRAYSAHELGRMCVDAGLRVVEISGSRHTRSRFYGSTSPEIWLLVEPK